ncbi:MAG: serine/threonine-protein kinase, partial [Gammaproteobacteria bacterium]|nr:serine/threonine-protein kinase [Gammaproteobacteria bacterium]
MSLIDKGKMWQRYTLPFARAVAHFGPSIRLLPTVVRKPRLAAFWLHSARRAQVALAVVALALFTAGPAAFGAIADTVFSPITEKKRVLIILKRDRTYDHPSRDTLYTALFTGSWVVGVGYVLMLLVNHAPGAVRLGQRRGRALLAEARQNGDPLESARLFTAAHGLLTTDTALGDASINSPAADSQGPAKTMLISMSKPETTRFLGNDNRYRLDKVIGSGGMGVVHAGYDTVLKRSVAFKQLFAHLVKEPEQNQRFRQEATALAALNHNHIVGIYDLLEESGSFWIVMELLTGGSLGDRLRDRAPMAIAYCVDVICKIADGLAYAHGVGMVHRDVKPMNILFTENGTPKLADFGNAKIAVPSVHTQHGVTLGSPIYMSPEQAAGEPADHRSDIYSLGVTL